MKARVFVTLKPSVFDPQGQTIADALHSMGYTGVGDVRQGKYFELELASSIADQARTLAAEVADKLLANPVIESYRIEVGLEVASSTQLPARSSWQLTLEAGSWKLDAAMKFAVVVFPGSNCDHDAYHAAKHVLGQEAEFVWHKETSLKGADVVILPGGFSHGDYCAPAPSRASRRSWRRSRDFARARRPGARHLQRLPDPAARRDSCPARCCATAT